MRQELPVIAITPTNRAIAITLRLYESGKDWVHNDRLVLHRLAAGLRGLRWPGKHCESSDPLRGIAHAHYVMDLHRGHNCPRYAMAADFATAATT